MESTNHVDGGASIPIIAYLDQIGQMFFLDELPRGDHRHAGGIGRNLAGGHPPGAPPQRHPLPGGKQGLPGGEGGRSLGECMSYTKELPGMLVQMTAVGEATGAMESTLKVLAEYYDNEVEVRTKRALALLEPAIIVVLAIFVVFILMAVYLPMFSMYASI